MRRLSRRTRPTNGDGRLGIRPATPGDEVPQSRPAAQLPRYVPASSSAVTVDDLRGLAVLIVEELDAIEARQMNAALEERARIIRTWEATSGRSVPLEPGDPVLELLDELRGAERDNSGLAGDGDEVLADAEAGVRGDLVDGGQQGVAALDEVAGSTRHESASCSSVAPTSLSASAASPSGATEVAPEGTAGPRHCDGRSPSSGAPPYSATAADLDWRDSSAVRASGSAPPPAADADACCVVLSPAGICRSCGAHWQLVPDSTPSLPPPPPVFRAPLPDPLAATTP
ncbi:hypothetical protein GCM10022237_25690 [Nocardioides ginsengisoli]